MKKNIIVYSFFILFIVFSCFPVAAATSNSCVTCHADENLMKRLYNPPPLAHSEEGEG